MSDMGNHDNEDDEDDELVTNMKVGRGRQRKRINRAVCKGNAPNAELGCWRYFNSFNLVKANVSKTLETPEHCRSNRWRRHFVRGVSATYGPFPSMGAHIEGQYCVYRKKRHWRRDVGQQYCQLVLCLNGTGANQAETKVWNFVTMGGLTMIKSTNERTAIPKICPRARMTKTGVICILNS